LYSITLITGRVLNILSGDTAKASIVIASGGYRCISGGNRTNVAYNVSAIGSIDNKNQNIKSLAFIFWFFNGREICGAWVIIL
jgi:hypothetical protein